MAKSPSRSKSASRPKKASGGSKRASSVRKSTAKRPRTAKAARPAPAREVELRPIRQQLHAAVKTLKPYEQSGKIKDAIRRLDVCLAEIQEICGPDMSIPLP